MSVWRRARGRLVLELGPPTHYTEPESEIAERLVTNDEVLGAELVEEAIEIARRQEEDVNSIERRAGALQGAVALATTLTVAGGALLLDTERIPSRGWRVVSASVLGIAAIAFVVSGIRAVGASSRTLPWAYPGYSDILERASTDLSRARGARCGFAEGSWPKPTGPRAQGWLPERCCSLVQDRPARPSRSRRPGRRLHSRLLMTGQTGRPRITLL